MSSKSRQKHRLLFNSLEIISIKLLYIYKYGYSEKLTFEEDMDIQVCYNQYCEIIFTLTG